MSRCLCALMILLSLAASARAEGEKCASNCEARAREAEARAREAEARARKAEARAREAEARARARQRPVTAPRL